MRYAIFLALCVAAANTQAQEEITFKGVQIGAPRAQFIEALPGIECLASSCMLNVARACRGTALQDAHTLRECRERYTYGGLVPISIMGLFDGDTLRSVIVTISERSFGDLLIAVRERFGPPELDTKFTVQNRAGATFDNQRVAWERGDTVLVLTRRATNIDESSAFIASKSKAAQSAREREQKAKAGAKDL